jgi:hypothetical protein
MDLYANTHDYSYIDAYLNVDAIAGANLYTHTHADGDSHEHADGDSHEHAATHSNQETPPAKAYSNSYALALLSLRARTGRTGWRST